MIRALVLAGAALLAACAPVSGDREAAAAPAPPSTAGQAFVAAAHPLAVEAGLDVLRRGGDATDAAIAVQAMLSLVEPQSSGLGGGAFLVRYDAASRRISVYDGRETAPAGARPDMFLGEDGKPLPFRKVVVSGRASGVPGVVKMLSLAHDRHGKLPWRTLFDETARAAEEGFVVSARLERFVHGNSAQASVPDVIAHFRNERGEKIRAGERLRNPAYARFVRRLAEQGPDALYKGETAKRIVARLREGPLPGTMTEVDLAAYTPEVREALCGGYRIYVLCTPPPPSSGVGLLQLMAMLEHTDIGARGPGDPVAWVRFAEASRVMYADRDAYIGDPAFGPVPVNGLLDPAYVASRARLVGTAAGAPPAAGTPPMAPAPAADRTLEVPGTSHFVVVDGAGNAVSMTTTVESLFGSGRMVDGFFLNNQMTDFSFVPEGPNAIAPGKRPRSSMVPTIILTRDGRFVGAIGSPGGNAILAYVGKALVGLIDWGLPMRDAIALPSLVARGASFAGEADKFAEPLRSAMRLRGVDVRSGSGEDSGLHGVIIRNGRFDGAADPRRDGIARSTMLPRRN